MPSDDRQLFCSIPRRTPLTSMTSVDSCSFLDSFAANLDVDGSRWFPGRKLIIRIYGVLARSTSRLPGDVFESGKVSIHLRMVYNVLALSGERLLFDDCFYKMAFMHDDTSP